MNISKTTLRLVVNCGKFEICYKMAMTLPFCPVAGMKIGRFSKDEILLIEEVLWDDDKQEFWCHVKDALHSEQTQLEKLEKDVCYMMKNGWVIEDYSGEIAERLKAIPGVVLGKKALKDAGD